MKYLLKQGSDFFSSQRYTDAVALFDSLKENVSLLPVTEVLADDPLLELLNAKLVEYYLTGEITTIDGSEKDKLLYLSLLSQLKENPRNEVIKMEMDKSTLDFDNSFEYSIKRIFESPLLIEMKSNDNYNRNTTSLTNAPLYPVKDNDPVKNIKELVSFFKSENSPAVFNKTEYSNIIFKNFMNKTLLDNATSLQQNGFYNSFTIDGRKFTDTELLMLLKEFLIDRYLSKSYNETSVITDVDTSIHTAVKNHLINITSTRYDFTLYIEKIETPSTTWTFQLNDAEGTVANNISWLVDGVDINSSGNAPTVSKTSTTVTLTFPTAQTGRMFVLVDTKNTFSTIKEYYNYTDDKRILSKKGNGTNTLDVFLTKPKDGILLEIDGAVISSVEYFKDKVRVTFDNPTDKMLYVLPVNRFSPSLTSFKVNDSNILEVLQTIDLFTERYQLWLT